MNESRTPSLLKRILVGANPRRTLLRAVVLAVFTYLVMRFVLLPTRIRGVSMEPTYTDGKIKFVNLLAYRFRQPQRGDIVVITMAGRRAFYLKRVIGVPGEHIEFIDGRLFVNGENVPEPYVQSRSDWTVPGIRLAGDEYYVAGDNRSIRWEYHSMGTVKREKILGSVFAGRK